MAQQGSKSLDDLLRVKADSNSNTPAGKPPANETTDQRNDRIENAQSAERVKADNDADARGSTLTHQTAENVDVKPIGNPGLGDPITGDRLHKDMGNTEPHHISIDKSGNVITGNTPSAAEVSVVAKIDKGLEADRKIEQGKAEQAHKDRVEKAEDARKNPERDENGNVIVRKASPIEISPPVVTSSIDTNSGVPEVDGDYVKGDRDQPPPRIDVNDQHNSDFTRMNTGKSRNVDGSGDIWLYSDKPGLGGWLNATRRFHFDGNYLKNVNRQDADQIVGSYSRYVHEVPNDSEV